MDSRVDSYFERFSPEQQAILQAARQIILNTHDGISEDFTYAVPFYKYHGLLCYLTFNNKRRRLVLGLCDGFQLDDPYGLLLAEDKQNSIKHLVLWPGQAPDAAVIQHYILLALEYKNSLKA